MKILYHGSPNKLEIGDFLKVASSLSNGKDLITKEYKPAIYATGGYEYAMYYALSIDSTNGGYSLEPYGTPKLFIMESADSIYGYVYELNGDNFHWEKMAPPKDEWVSFSDEQIVGRKEIGVKQLLDMGYDVRVKKANFKKGADKIRKACTYQEQSKNPDQLKKLLDEYTVDARTLV